MIGIVTDLAVGGTFTDWSLHYLNDDLETYNVKSGWNKLVDTPLNNTNAHGFISNQPVCADDVYKIIDKLQNVPTLSFHSIYCHNLLELGNPWQFASNSTNTNALEHLFASCDKIIHVHNSFPLYYVTVEHRGAKETFQSWLQHFYPDNEVLNNIDQHSIWDVREQLALGKHSLTSNTLPSIVHPNVYKLDCMDLWTRFENEILFMFASLGLKLSKTRWQKWLEVYTHWKTQHTKRVNFIHFADKITDAIVNGQNVDLTAFELDIMQEAYIQHTLIYKHDLNLKTWQLEKFTNTLELYNRLEKNIHSVNTGI